MLSRVTLSLEESTVIHRVDPRVKLFAIVAISVLSVMISSLSSLILLAVLPLSLLVVSRCLRRAAFFLFMLLAFSVISVLFVYFTGLGSPFEFGKFFVRIFAVVCIGLVFAFSTPPSKFAKALEKMRFPKSVVFTLTLTLRFIPVFMNEVKDLTDSLKVRGVELGLKGILRRPYIVFRALIIPLMIRMMKIADDLASAMEARGFGAPVKRTSLYDYKISWMDAAFTAIVIAWLGSLLLLDFSHFSFLDVQLFWGYIF
ncbi:MAG: energy-coupling factor transporter transmembrane component T family protein [Candidatus Jordarchaeum sp.]|uniref:energy-coupling factor transporter transmembrane component T family protein n=1 Tax=Candidatus Jordarchaeum sp. TaxID=2823881 RepID=UPI004049FBBC